MTLIANQKDVIQLQSNSSSMHIVEDLYGLYLLLVLSPLVALVEEFAPEFFAEHGGTVLLVLTRDSTIGDIAFRFRLRRRSGWQALRPRSWTTQTHELKSVKPAASITVFFPPASVPSFSSHHTHLSLRLFGMVLKHAGSILDSSASDHTWSWTNAFRKD